MAAFNIKAWIKNYFAKKKWYSIVSDAVFIVLIVLLIIPSTRIEVTSFFIRLTSFNPSTLDANEQFKISEQAESWEVYNMQGQKFSLSDLNDKPIFINFWATWCPPCVAELPGIAELHEEYKNDVNFIIVSNESNRVIREFVSKKDYDEQVFYQNTDVPYDFSSSSIPATFVINKQGVVVVSKKGAARWNSGRMKEIIENLISE